MQVEAAVNFLHLHSLMTLIPRQEGGALPRATVHKVASAVFKFLQEGKSMLNLDIWARRH